MQTVIAEAQSPAQRGWGGVYSNFHTGSDSLRAWDRGGRVGRVFSQATQTEVGKPVVCSNMNNTPEGNHYFNKRMEIKRS